MKAFLPSLLITLSVASILHAQSSVPSPPVVTTQPSAPAPQPLSVQNMDDVKALMEAAKYPDAIRGIGLLLYSGGPQNPDRRELLLLRAESTLQLKQDAAAIDTLALVQKEADQVGDIPDSSRALALAFLIKKSSGHKYFPKTGSEKSPIDILDKNTRPAAYSALFADEFARFQQQRRNASLDTSLAPILHIADEFTQLRALEIAASNSTPQTDTLALNLAKWADSLINSTITDFNHRMDRISVDDNISAEGKRKAHRPAGLTPADAQTLRNIAAVCQRIPDAVDYLTHAFAHTLQLSHVATNAINAADRANSYLKVDARINSH